LDQPTAEKTLAALEPLIGEWTQEATPPGGEPWPSFQTDFDLVLKRVE
jgi:hypothetical protein